MISSFFQGIPETAEPRGRMTSVVYEKTMRETQMEPQKMSDHLKVKEKLIIVFVQEKLAIDSV